MPDKSSVESYKKIFQHCAVGMAHVSPEGRFIKVNPQLCRFLGYDEAELTQLTFQAVTPEKYLAEDMGYVQGLLDGEAESYEMEKEYVHKQGHTVWARLTVSLVRNEQGEADFFVSVIEDIDQAKRVAAKLESSEETFRNIVAAFSDHLIVWVASAGLESLFYINEGAQKIFGKPTESLRTNPLSFIRLIHPQDLNEVTRHYRSNPDTSWKLEYRIIKDNGEIRHIRDRGNVIYDNSGKVKFLVGTAEDITVDKHLHEALVNANHKLAKLIRVDSLTGLSNRREILRNIDGEIHRMNRIGGTATLLFLDLNKFKQINDQHGHLTGDKALKVFAQGMQNGLRETDFVGRYGGDEFLILLCDSDENDTETFIDRIRAQKLVTENEQGDPIELSFSCGFTCWNAGIQTAQQWVSEADHKMYEDKNRGR